MLQTKGMGEFRIFFNVIISSFLVLFSCSHKKFLLIESERTSFTRLRMKIFSKTLTYIQLPPPIPIPLQFFFLVHGIYSWLLNAFCDHDDTICEYKKIYANICKVYKMCTCTVSQLQKLDIIYACRCSLILLLIQNTYTHQMDVPVPNFRYIKFI